MGVLFNGSSQRVDVANESAFDWERTQAFSAACWFYREPSAPTGGGALLVGKAGPPGWALDQHDFGGSNYTFSAHLINSPGNEIWKYGPSGSIMKGSWNHIAFTYDGSSTLTGVLLYLNGALVGTGGGTNVDALSASILTNEPLAVGGIGAGPEWFDGAVAFPVVDDVVWTAADVAKLADLRYRDADLNALLSSPPKWWSRFKTTADLTDVSGNGNNGTAVGSPTTFAGPTVAIDQWPVGTGGFTTSTSWTHTPVGTLQGVVVLITQGTVATDRISAVTYGGVPMTRVQFAQDTVGEPGAAYAYFLGGTIPTGSQSVAVTVSAGTETKAAQSVGLRATGPTRVAASGKQEGDVANPSITLPTLASFEGMVFASLLSGANATSSHSPGANFANMGSVSFGAQSVRNEWGTLSGANVVADYAAASDDVAMVALAIEAIPADTRPFVRSDAVHRRSRW